MLDTTLPAPDESSELDGLAVPMLPARYAFRSVLGTGGTGIVLRVYDRHLERPLAMKVLRPELHRVAAARSRLLREARLTAGMRHPDIVTVLDAGELDGLPWYTMPEIAGARTLGAVLREVAANEMAVEPALRLLARAAAAAGHAHARGVVHRDLKPANILVGTLGEVLLLDWGVALALSDGAPTADTMGRVGTPPYMPPEQHEGALARQGPRSDVYALGVLVRDLFHAGAQVVLPDDLAGLVGRATAERPEARPPDGGAVAEVLLTWLRRSAGRARAERAVGQADAIGPRLSAARGWAAERRAEAAVKLATARPESASEARAAAWALEDEATAREVEAELLDMQREQTLKLAVEHDPDYEPAHVRLATVYHERLLAAERQRSASAAARWEALVRAHARGPAASLLDTHGYVTLVTDPPGAEVDLFACRLDGRRLVAVPAGSLGRTPLEKFALERGSWVLQLRAAGRAPVRYPVSLDRGEHWDGRPPDGTHPAPVGLPRADALGVDDVYVPGGWFRAGGDVSATDPLPAARIWVNPFVIRRFPVTVGEYAAFLTDIARRDGPGAAARHVPDEGGEGALPRLAWDGAAFRPAAPTEGPPWSERRPVTLVSAASAEAYAAWESARSGRPWRLPLDLEREKAARGVDGRTFPWGDHFEPEWARCADTPPRPVCADIDAHPEDESPYGVRGLAGNVRDWCADRYRRHPATPPLPDAPRAVRGGAWTSSPHLCRAATRFGTAPNRRLGAVGFRLARSLTPADYGLAG